MKKKKSLNTATIISLLILCASIALLIFAIFSSSSPAEKSTLREDGTQEITIRVKGGYSPEKIDAKANTETVLKVVTDNTYDCSLALQIPDIKVDTFLDSTGERVCNSSAKVWHENRGKL